ncbi:twinfilin isoform X2 [Diorhabda carinulata]|uniref:twinfilin isoform X2 n=1 Tax=Diorhabda carinulata TaxID=1163345 RepID=UPI0025A16FE9|nr:twinfilin isoform X2 [Diorhabda carinulata]
MSHQTGIKANEELLTFFAKCRDGTIRLIKVIIHNEQLCLDNHKKTQNTWDKDFDPFIQPLIEENQPCYILYRLDSKDSLGYEWLFISWSPDIAPIRQKMLYASTKATLKQEFGTSHIKEEIHGTIAADITLNGYIKYKKSAAAPAPLSMREEELQELKRTEVNTDISVDTKQQTLGGVVFPITEPAKQAILDMVRGLYDYLQFRIVFIYSMPGYSCPIKERMLYSSCKNPFTDTVSSLGLEIAKKLEIDSGDELIEKYLYDELHPTNTLHRPQFARPKGPPNRGPKRMTKSNDH